MPFFLLPTLTTSQMVNAAPSPLSLLQRFLILQQTRAAISNELTGAFNEQGISDAALNKVVEISSIGFLDVRQEVQEIIDKLAREHYSQDVLAEVSAMKSIEELEKKRITELTRAHQLRRIRSLLESGEKDDNDDDDVAIQARKIEITEQITQAERSITTLTQDIAEHIDTIRETVADMS